MLSKNIKRILDDIENVKKIYQQLLRLLPSFNVTDKKILPYGLKPHTRSVSWLVEQVITQQTKYRAKELGLGNVDFDLPDTSLHDCEIQKASKTYFVNVKIQNVDGKDNKNDIAAVEKLFMQYTTKKDYDLIYACFGIKFQGINIKFETDYLHLFSPQFLPIYVNPRNDKIQSYYYHEPILRERKEFLELLQQNSRSIKL